MKFSYLKEQEKWEQARFISYIICQIYSKKKLKPADIISFNWESNKLNDIDIKSERERMKKLANEYINSLKHGDSKS